MKAALLAVLLVCIGCGGPGSKPPPVVRKETSLTEILRVGRSWRSTLEESGLNSAPSPISVFKRRATSTLQIGQSQERVTETLMIVEDFELQNGRRHTCASGIELQVRVVFGRKGSEAAVALHRKELALTRECEPPGFPEAVLTIPEADARFVLRGDRLVAYAPPLEKREYLPIQ